MSDFDVIRDALRRGNFWLADRPGLYQVREAALAALSRIEARMVLLEGREDWLRKQIDGAIEGAEAVAFACNLATARAVVGDLKDAREALGEAE